MDNGNNGKDKKSKIERQGMYWHIAEMLTYGMSQRAISRKTGVCRDTVKKIINNPEFAEIFTAMSEEIFHTIKGRVIRRLKSMIMGNDDKIALKAIRIVLNIKGSNFFYSESQ